MATYPHAPVPGGIVAALNQLRKGFPTTVDAGFLKRSNIAPSNESYIISILKFLGVIDEDGKRIDANTDYFFADDNAFKSGLEGTIRKAYAMLFEDMGGDAPFGAEKSALIHWFRAVDKTSDLVGQRQANTFVTLAGMAGRGELPTVRSAKPAAGGATAKKTPAKKAAAAPKINPPVNPAGGSGAGGGKNGQEVGVTVRIEVNLPPDGDAETYDAIFASIKKHLMS